MMTEYKMIIMRKILCAIGKAFSSEKPSALRLNEKQRRGVKKILIFKLGAIGDVLMTTPFLRQVRKAYPHAEITYLTGEFCKTALEGNPNIDKLETFDHNIIYKKSIPGLLRLIKRMKKEKYDVCFICDMHYMINVLVRMFKIPLRIGFDRYGEGFPNTNNVKYEKVKHAIDYYLEPAYAAGAPRLKSNEQKHLDIFITKKDENYADAFLKKNKVNLNRAVCVAPGGAKNPGQDMKTRRWPAENYAELVHKLTDAGYTVIIVGGPDDKKIVNEMQKHHKFSDSDNIINLTGKTTIKQCCAVIARCRLAVVNDSGIMHFASAVNTPALSLFGVTDPRRKAPLPTKNTKHSYIWKKPKVKGWNDDGIFSDFKNADDIRKIKVSEVFEKAKKML